MVGTPDRICNFAVWSDSKIPRCEGKTFNFVHDLFYINIYPVAVVVVVVVAVVVVVVVVTLRCHKKS
jgi:hypothetical protein